MTAPQRIDIEVGGKQYNISTTSIPYFASYTSFQRRTGQAADKHGDIPFFDAAYRGVEYGFRHCFRALGTDLAEYHALCDTLDLLCVDTLGGRCINAISQDLKSGNGRYQGRYERHVFPRVNRTVARNKTVARDSAFRLLYLLLRGELDDDTETKLKVYKAVFFVVSHRDIFKYHARMIVRAAYEERFDVAEKQRAELDRWPAGTPTTWSDYDVTTDDGSDGLDSHSS